MSNCEMAAAPHQDTHAGKHATNPDDNGAAIGLIVARAAAALGCRPPRISIRSMRNACYNPLAHRISVSSRLVRDLPADLLEVLIAHEVGHAAQRREILSDAARVLPWSLGVLLVTLLLLRPDEVLSGILDAAILEVTDDACGVLFERHHVRTGSFT